MVDPDTICPFCVVQAAVKPLAGWLTVPLSGTWVTEQVSVCGAAAAMAGVVVLELTCAEADAVQPFAKSVIRRV